MKRYIYLAGPITGKEKNEANSWREYVSQAIAPNIVGISPLRYEPLVGTHYTTGNGDPRFGIPIAIRSKNLLDVRNCDLIVAYLPKIQNDHVSKGTLIEIGWANIIGKPVILVSDDPEIFQHPVISQSVSWIVTDLDQAIDIIKGIFDVYSN